MDGNMMSKNWDRLKSLGMNPDYSWVCEHCGDPLFVEWTMEHPDIFSYDPDRIWLCKSGCNDKYGIDGQTNMIPNTVMARKEVREYWRNRNKKEKNDRYIQKCKDRFYVKQYKEESRKSKKDFRERDLNRYLKQVNMAGYELSDEFRKWEKIAEEGMLHEILNNPEWKDRVFENSLQWHKEVMRFGKSKAMNIIVHFRGVMDREYFSYINPHGPSVQYLAKYNNPDLLGDGDIFENKNVERIEVKIMNGRINRVIPFSFKLKEN